VAACALQRMCAGCRFIDVVLCGSTVQREGRGMRHEASVGLRVSLGSMRSSMQSADSGVTGWGSGVDALVALGLV